MTPDTAPDHTIAIEPTPDGPSPTMVIPLGQFSDDAIADLRDLWDRCHRVIMPSGVAANVKHYQCIDGRWEPLN